MATATILQLPQAVGGLLGTEQCEAAQPTTLPNGQPGFVSIRLTTAQIAALAAASKTPSGLITGIPSGTQNDYTVGGQMGPAVGFIDLSPTAPCNITGLAAGIDGQLVVITCLTAFATTLNALNAGSLAANRFRMASDAILTQNNGRSFKYSATIGLWVAL
jgi:hypothetical protein